MSIVKTKKDFSIGSTRAEKECIVGWVVCCTIAVLCFLVILGFVGWHLIHPVLDETEEAFRASHPEYAEYVDEQVQTQPWRDFGSDRVMFYTEAEQAKYQAERSAVLCVGVVMIVACALFFGGALYFYHKSDEFSVKRVKEGNATRPDFVQVNSDYDPDTYLRITRTVDNDVIFRVRGDGEMRIATSGGQFHGEQLVAVCAAVDALMSALAMGDMEFEPMVSVSAPVDVDDNSPCVGCIHRGCCGMEQFDTSGMTEEEAFREHCCGCPCGDCFDCNRESGCSNYDTEPD